jgi:hypothetical protein
MHFYLRLSAAILVLLTATGGAEAADPKTIRIEPRAFYGATVSIESGVRVFRPLPSTSHVIINPNQTPLNLTIKDVTKRSYSTSRHYYYGGGDSSGSRVVGGYLPFVNDGFYGRRHKRGIWQRRPGRPGGHHGGGRPGGRR